MANTIRIKRSTGSSAPSSLANAELAFAEGSKKLFIGVGSGGAGGSATTIEAIGGTGSFFDKVTSQTANYVLAAPDGSAGAATYRALAVGDIPTLTASKVSDFDTQVRTNRLDQLTAPSASVSLNSQKITNLASPVASTDAASKQYVDNNSQGLDVKASVRVATTTNGTLASAFANGQTVDGVTLATNDRILLKDQSTGTENGIYVIAASGAPTRADDYAAGAGVASSFCFVEAGTTNADSGWTCTNNKSSDVVGSDALTYAQFSGAGQITAGNGLEKSGNTISADLKANGGAVIESGEIAIDLSASSITGTLGLSDGGTGATTAAGVRTALSLVVGTDIQAFDQQLADVAGLAVTDGGFIVGNGSNFVLETGATARTSLGIPDMEIDGGTY